MKDFSGETVSVFKLQKRLPLFWVAGLSYSIVCLIGVVMSFYPTLFSGFSRMQTDPGDTRLVQYILEHSFQVVFNQNYAGELWSPAFFYPLKNMLALSENMWGTAPLYWLFRGFLSSDIAYQIWMICVMSLCFFCFVVLLRHFQIHPTLSAFGGFLFAFGMPRAAQIGHQQLLPQFFTPLAFLFLWGFVRSPTNRRFILFLFFTYLQILASIYLGWMFLFSVLIFLPVVFFVSQKARVNVFAYFKSHYRTAIATLLIWFTLLFLLLNPYLKMGKVMGDRPFFSASLMLPRLNSWMTPPEGSPWFRLLAPLSRNLPKISEHRLFMGLTIILLTGFVVCLISTKSKFLEPDRRLLIQSCLITALAIFVLSLSLFDYSLWELVHALVPGAKAMRAVARICLLFYFYLLIAVLLGLDSFLRIAIASKKSRLALICTICLFGMSEQLIINPYSFEKAPLLHREAELQELMSQGCEVAYVYDSGKNPDWIEQTSAMWAGMKTNVPVVNGYSGWKPRSHNYMVERKGFPGLIKWLQGRFQGQLCYISETIEPRPSGWVMPDRQAVSFSKTFKLGVFQLPLSHSTQKSG
ncbi:hypothetical protein [Phormidesmis sp. 146-33]